MLYPHVYKCKVYTYYITTLYMIIQPAWCRTDYIHASSNLSLLQPMTNLVEYI